MVERAPGAALLGLEGVGPLANRHRGYGSTVSCETVGRAAIMMHYRGGSRLADNKWLDAPRGFEPRLTESESVVLPLDDGATGGRL